MEDGFALWDNPSSPHAEGRKARAALENARERIKAALGWNGELIFTSGASEALEIGLRRAQVDRRIVSAVEHDAVFRAAPDAEVVPVDLLGMVHGDLNFERLDGLLAKAGRSVVAVQHINSETGENRYFTYDPPHLVCVAKAQGLLLADCSQSAGKFELPKVDMIVVSAHKFGGPVGVGALLIRDFAMLDPIGGHERGYRQGTENLPAVLGMVAALESCSSPYVPEEVLKPLIALADDCRELGGTWLSDRLSVATPYIHAVAMPNMSASAQVMRFDMAGIAVSQGSACSSGTMKTSRVLEAMQVEPEIAANTIRVSVGWNTTRAEVERFCEVWLDLARK